MNRIRRMTVLAVLVAAAFATFPACGGKGGGDAKMKTYPDGVDGLKAFMTDFSAAANGGSDKLAKEMGDSLVLAKPEEFFNAYYPEDIATRLVAEYNGMKPSSEPLIKMLQAQKAKGRTEFLVEKFDKVADENAVGYQEYALKEQLKNVTFYSFRALPPGKVTGQHLYNFIYVNGAWKLAGPMKSIKEGMMDDPKMDAIASLRAKERESYFNTGKLPGDP